MHVHRLHTRAHTRAHIHTHIHTHTYIHTCMIHIYAHTSLVFIHEVHHLKIIDCCIKAHLLYTRTHVHTHTHTRQGRAEGGFQGFQETPLEFHQLALRN